MMYYLDKSITEGNSDEVNPEIDAEDVYNRKDFFRKNYYNEFIEPEPFFNDLKLYQRLSGDSIPTILNDVHGWAGRYPNKLWSFPVSERFKNVLDQFTIIKSRLYPGSLNFHGEIYPYFIFHTLGNGWGDVIDFNSSIFTNWKNTGSEKLDNIHIRVNSVEEYLYKCKELKDETENIYTIRHTYGPDEIHFTQNVDLIYLPILRWVISERLKQALEKANISGLEYDPITNVDFYYQGEKI